MADGLLYAVQYGLIDPTTMTPELVESIIHGKSWVIRTDGESSGAFPSPVDLCEHVNNHIPFKFSIWESDEKIVKCLEKMRLAAAAPSRCAAFTDEGSSLMVSSDHKQACFLQQ